MSGGLDLSQLLQGLPIQSNAITPVVEGASPDEIGHQVVDLYGRWYDVRHHRHVVDDKEGVGKNFLIPLVDAIQRKLSQDPAPAITGSVQKHLSAPQGAGNSTALVRGGDHRVGCVGDNNLPYAQLQSMVAEHRTALDAEEAGIKTALQGLMGMYVRSRAFTLEGTVAAEHAGNAGTLTLHNVRPLDRMALYYLFNEHEVPVLNIGPGVDSVDALYRILFEHLPGAKSHSELRSFFPEERDLALINHFHDKHYAVIPLHDVGSSSQYFAAFLTGRSAEHSADIFRTENVSVCRFHGTRYKKTPGFPVFASGYFDDADWEMPGFKQHRFTELLATVYTTFVQEGIYDKLHLKMQTATR